MTIQHAHAPVECSDKEDMSSSAQALVSMPLIVASSQQLGPKGKQVSQPCYQSTCLCVCVCCESATIIAIVIAVIDHSCVLSPNIMETDLTAGSSTIIDSSRVSRRRSVAMSTACHARFGKHDHHHRSDCRYSSILRFWIRRRHARRVVKEGRRDLAFNDVLVLYFFFVLSPPSLLRFSTRRRLDATCMSALASDRDTILEQYKYLQNGSDIRGVAIEGVQGEPVTLTPAAATDIARAFARFTAEKTGAEWGGNCSMMGIRNGLRLKLSSPEPKAQVLDHS